MTVYRHSLDDADEVSKHGIDLSIYDHHDPLMTVARVSVARGHFQEFYNTRSSYSYYILSGRGTFYLNDEVETVGATDLVTAPPGTRILYFGTMTMLLTVAPAFDERDEHHVRFIDETESPY